MKEREINIDDKPHIKVLIIEDDEGHAAINLQVPLESRKYLFRY